MEVQLNPVRDTADLGNERIYERLEVRDSASGARYRLVQIARMRRHVSAELEEAVNEPLRLVSNCRSRAGHAALQVVGNIPQLTGGGRAQARNLRHRPVLEILQY